MVAVIIGDIVSSRRVKPDEWMAVLEQKLKKAGRKGRYWEIFRGDSFQLKLRPELALEQAFLIKAAIRSIRGLDVRMAIGIGDESLDSPKVTTSQGTAYENAGHIFDDLKKKRMVIKSPWPEWDESLNIMLSLAALTTDNWTPTSAGQIEKLLLNPALTQNDLADMLGKYQGSVSEALRRGGYNEIRELLNYYKSQLEPYA